MRHHSREGLAQDLQAMAALDRRSLLGLVAGTAPMALLAGCGGASGSGSVETSSGSTTATPTPSPTPSPTPTPTSAASGCVADPVETNGPYPADGTNTAPGLTSNVLTQSGIVRSDIRSSFLNGSTTTAPGVSVTLSITVVDVNQSCAALPGFALYVWHCDRDGHYSLYDVPAESWLRGVLVTDTNGQAVVTTIFPGCYSGRYPHVHFELFSSLSAATGGRYAALISQFAMPADACNTVYASSGYTTSASNFARISTASDNVFGDNSAAQLAQQTIKMTGNATDGYTASVVVGIAR